MWIQEEVHKQVSNGADESFRDDQSTEATADRFICLLGSSTTEIEVERPSSDCEFSSRATAREIHRSWMNSPGHKANILRPQFKEIGIGIALGAAGAGSNGATYTVDFGARR